jgi:hypothetical protein
MNLFESTFWGHEQMLTPAILNVSTSVLWLGIILFCTSKINFSVNQLFSIFIAIQVLTALCYFIVLYSKKAFKGTVQPFFSSSKALILCPGCFKPTVHLLNKQFFGYKLNKNRNRLLQSYPKNDEPHFPGHYIFSLGTIS